MSTISGVSTSAFKYPSTPHLPFSETVTSDLTLTKNGLDFSSGVELIVTEKMDGGNISMYRDGFHARSLDSDIGTWDHLAKAECSARRFLIPERYRISGEYLAARRSVAYHDLKAPILVFGAWYGEQLLDWDETQALADSIGLPTVSVLYRGTDWNGALNAWSKFGRTSETSEGFVVRYSGAFSLQEFPERIANISAGRLNRISSV